MLVLLIAAMLQLGSPSRSSPLTDAPKPWVGKRIVELGKQRYRVTIKDTGEVVVVSKAVFSRRNVQMHDEMLQAVRQATGCRLGQELWEGNALHGKLACDDATPL